MVWRGAQKTDRGDAAGRKPRRAAAGALSIAPLAVLVLTQLQATAPPRMPVGWDPWEPSSFVAGSSVLAAVIGIVTFAALFSAASALMSFVIPAGISRWLITLTGAGSAAALLFYVVVGERSRVDPDQVTLLWPLIVLILTCAWAVVIYTVHGREILPLAEVIAQIPAHARIPADPPGALTGWRGTSASPFMARVAAFSAVCFAAGAVAVAIQGPILLALVLLVVGVVTTGYTLAWSKITIEAGQRGLRVRSAALPIGLYRLSADQIVGLTAADLDPMSWGGYGVRVTRGRFGYVVTGGTGLVVHRADGRQDGIEITDGDPSAAVQQLQLAVAQARSSG